MTLSENRSQPQTHTSMAVHMYISEMQAVCYIWKKMPTKFVKFSPGDLVVCSMSNKKGTFSIIRIIKLIMK